MAKPVRIALYSDLSCPFAYVTAYRLRQLRDEYRGRVVIERKSLSLEYVNRVPTPKESTIIEAQFLMATEPEIPFEPWHRPASEWPVTIWPAFEAVKCAESQGPDAAEEFDWAVRRALFAESRCISMRNVLIELAERTGLDLPRFVNDFDSGTHKRQVLRESQQGWEQLKVEGSPTFVLPSGKQYSGLGLATVELDEARNDRVTVYQPAPCSGDACLDLYREMFHEAGA